MCEDINLEKNKKKQKKKNDLGMTEEEEMLWVYILGGWS